jgi:2-keto-4-pentenoate hydratase/2-oxohepta-3-ene-1,7-dioic acid hydratase in catechol pathway
MKFVRYEHEGATGLGVLNLDETEVVPLLGILCCNPGNMIDFIRCFDDDTLHEVTKMRAAGREAVSLRRVKLSAPIEKPVHDIICAGMNYFDHLDECVDAMDFAPPEATVYFSKRANKLIGPGEDIKGEFGLDKCLDYEVELAVIIGKNGRDIAVGEAENYIFGYSIFNDITSRTIQKLHSQWFLGKSVEGTSVLGPAILHKSGLPIPFDLEIGCSVNNEVRQLSNTGHLIKKIPEMISELSKVFELVPGDIIATGTPGGVGMSFSPPKYLKPGDSVECFIEGIGVLKNTIVS